MLFLSMSVFGKKQPAVVILTAGQSNTDGRVMNENLPDYIQKNKYKFCKWSYGCGTTSGGGRFETFWPRIVSQRNPNRWAYDAVVYYLMEKKLKRDFYVIKESLGGTAIDTLCTSSNKMYWSADPAFLSRTAAADKGGKSLLKAFTENIGACIDGQLSQLTDGYDIKFMLWHQGESDSRRGRGACYYDNMKAVVAYVRNYLVQKTGRKQYAHLPIICGTVSHASKLYNKDVESALYRLAKEDSNFHVVDISDGTLGKDQLHFDANGAETLGKRMYEVIKKL